MTTLPTSLRLPVGLTSVRALVGAGAAAAGAVDPVRSAVAVGALITAVAVGPDVPGRMSHTAPAARAAAIAKAPAAM